MLRPWEFHFSIDTKQKKAVYLQIADALIEAIKSGKLQKNDPLPGSRLLASQLKVNRNTVIQALNLLLAEGWLTAKERRGTFISQSLPEREQSKDTGTGPSIPEAADKAPRIVFDDGIPDSRLAPINELARAYRYIFNQKGKWKMMGYNSETGNAAFRNAIAQMLNYKRSMHLSADNVFITRGSQMAMYLASQILIRPGDYVAVEDPGYLPAWETIEHAGAELLYIAVDAEGMVTDQLEAYLLQGKNIRAVYITPHHQFPTTVTMALSRRLHLVSLSNSYGFTIIEDDYDNEFHFDQRPVMPICSLGHVQNFVYLGTMSKVVAPALRIGYLATNTKNIQQIADLRRIIDVQGDNIMEQAVLQLIADGEIKRHIKRATAKYRAKRDYFEQLIQKYLAGRVIYTKPAGGLAFWIEPVQPADLDSLANRLLEDGIKIMAPEKFGTNRPLKGLRLGYASLSEQELEEGVKAIGARL